MPSRFCLRRKWMKQIRNFVCEKEKIAIYYNIETVALFRGSHKRAHCSAEMIGSRCLPKLYIYIWRRLRMAINFRVCPSAKENNARFSFIHSSAFLEFNDIRSSWQLRSWNWSWPHRSRTEIQKLRILRVASLPASLGNNSGKIENVRPCMAKWNGPIEPIESAQKAINSGELIL